MNISYLFANWPPSALNIALILFLLSHSERVLQPVQCLCRVRRSNDVISTLDCDVA